MIDEDELSQAASRAARAQALLGNELLAQAYEQLEADVIAEWIAAPDVVSREAAWRMIHTNRKHKAYLESVVGNGKLAASDLKRLAETTERKKRFGLI